MENKAQKITILGGLMASVMASACCIGPVFLALLGVSSAGIFTAMDSYRTYLIVTSSIFLIIAFYYTYKTPGGGACIEGSLCANPKTMKRKKALLWFSAVLILSFITFPTWSLYFV